MNNDWPNVLNANAKLVSKIKLTQNDGQYSGWDYASEESGGGITCEIQKESILYPTQIQRLKQKCDRGTQKSDEYKNMMTRYCQQKDTSDPRLPKPMLRGADCQDWLQVIKKTDSTEEKNRLSDVIKTNFCRANPTLDQCACIMRADETTKAGKSFKRIMDAGAAKIPTQDVGCWYTPCQDEPINLLTSDVLDPKCDFGNVCINMIDIGKADKIHINNNTFKNNCPPAACTTTNLKCKNGGTVKGTVGKCSCDCLEGFSGPTCEDNRPAPIKHPCTTSNLQCKNGGTVKSIVGKCSCDCPEGFSGPTCEDKPPSKPTDPCGGCEHGGVCTDEKCKCSFPWIGPKCGISWWTIIIVIVLLLITAVVVYRMVSAK